MQIEKAKEITKLLANGINPTTGEVFPDDSPYNHPKIIRALFTLLNHIEIPKIQNKLSAKDRRRCCINRN